MSKRRKKFQHPTWARCDRCGDRVTHVLQDPDGDCIRACSPCWAVLRLLIESAGGQVSDCSCWECLGLTGPEAGTWPARPDGRGGRRASAEPRPPDGRTRPAAGAGGIRGPV